MMRQAKVGSWLAPCREHVVRVQETKWRSSKAHSIETGFKLFYHGADRKSPEGGAYKECS